MLRPEERLSDCIQYRVSDTLVRVALVDMLQYYMSDTVSICTLDGTVKTILHKIREDLLTYRKCFSGAHLISWIMNHPELFYQFGTPDLLFLYHFVNEKFCHLKSIPVLVCCLIFTLLQICKFIMIIMMMICKTMMMMMMMMMMMRGYV